MRRSYSETFVPTGDNRWRATNEGVQDAKTGVMDLSNFTKSEHYPQGFIPSGLPVNAADMNNLKPFTGVAGEVLRFIVEAQEIKDGETVLAVPVQLHGSVYPQLIPGGLTLPVEADTTGWVFVTPAPAVVLGAAKATA